MKALRSGSRLLEAAAILLATRAILAASPRRLAAQLLRRASSLAADDATPVNAPRDALALEVTRDVERIAPLVVGSTCLSRALTGWVMLRRRGVPSTVRVGAKPAPDTGVLLHAWLEVAGVPLIGREEAADIVALTR